jgi:hypothetical protein
LERKARPQATPLFRDGDLRIKICCCVFIKRTIKQWRCTLDFNK